MPTNSAPNRFLAIRKTGTLECDATALAPASPPPAGHVVLRAAAWASNPCDYKLMRGIIPAAPHLPLGNDVAGTIIAVGPGVTNVAVGERVVAFTKGFAATLMDPKESGAGFQNEPTVLARAVFKIPANVAFERAVVASLTVATAAITYFHSWKMERPSAAAGAAVRASPLSEKKAVVFVYSGGSSLGRQLILLAAAAGYAVVAAASPSRADELKQLGAVTVVDYRLSDDDFTRQAVAAIEATGLKLLGVADAYSSDISPRRVHNLVSALRPELYFASKVLVSFYLVVDTSFFDSSVCKVHIELVFDLLEEPLAELCEWLFVDYMSDAVASGAHVLTPKPLIVGQGLDDIPKAVAVAEKGLSGEKAVVLA